LEKSLNIKVTGSKQSDNPTLKKLKIVYIGLHNDGTTIRIGLKLAEKSEKTKTTINFSALSVFSI
jgi:hypothetical protein